MPRRVAVATTDGRFIDTHFGHADRFDVYELGDGGVGFVETRRSAAACSRGRHEDSAFDAALAALGDCEAIFVSVIGYGAARYLNQKGMRVFESPYSAVAEVLSHIVSDGTLERGARRAVSAGEGNDGRG
jgi:predicted Fe-Mo cluster-binding NifX family protein